MEKAVPTTSEKKKKSAFWRYALMSLVWTWVLLLIGIIVAGMVAFIVYDHVTREGKRGSAVVITVPPGATLRMVGELLVENKIIEHEGLFRLALRLKNEDVIIKQGAYELYRGLSAAQLLELLVQGPTKHLHDNQERFLIPEGLSIPQIAVLTSHPEAFMEATRDEALIASLGIETDTLEGFLMPNTYFFDEEPHPALLVNRMVEQFKKEWDQLITENPGAAAMQKIDLVTVASLVEREAKAEEERPLVAQVIYNRLESKMRLQMDSTLQFALNKYGERMLDVDKNVRSPYNTYQHGGLPPGPICNPGVASLRAAMAPADGQYLYFVSNADGTTHTFSRTLEEHNQAVRKYNREIAPQRAEEPKTRQPARRRRR